MNAETQNILSLLLSTFEKNAWHGPSVKEVLKDITPVQAYKKLEHTHSIIELVAHMTSWRIFVIKKLEGDINYKVNDELNFPAVTDWVEAVEKLSSSQSRLIELIKKIPGSRLSEIVPHDAHGYTFRTLIHGIIHHDLYHIGQIALIKKTINTDL